MQLQSMPCPTVAATIMSRSYDFSLGSNDNGNVQSVTNCLDTTRTQSFTYDSLNRISTGQSSGTGSTSWGEQYHIDAWGNLTNINPVPGKTNYEGLTCASANTKNQLNTCYGYDAPGNLTQNGTINYTYDAENRLVWSTNGYEYIYDGDGNRVVKCTSGSQSNTCPAGSTGTLYWRYGGGDTIVESSLTGTSLEEYVFFNGQRVARRDVSTNAVHYYFSDHLGTHAVVENATGTSCEQDIDYYPYGGVEHDYCPNAPQNYKFTGKERDAESGLDNFGARYYASGFGRFMTPDWAARATAVPYAVFGDPQSLNLYGYVRNDPVSRVDPDGHLDQPLPDLSQHAAGSMDMLSAGSVDDAAATQRQVLAAQGHPQAQNQNNEQVLIAQNQNPNPQTNQQNKPQPNVPQEIKDIHSAFDKKVAEMTNNGERINNGPLNNIVSTVQRIGEAFHLTKHHLCSCNEQAETVSNSLNSSMKNTSYTFGLKQSWTHSWVEGTSSVKGAPVLVLDPWKNKFEVQQ